MVFVAWPINMSKHVDRCVSELGLVDISHLQHHIEM
jgi:hypothetical protein